MKGNILYEGGFVLPPGSYHLKVVARENESGKLGTFEEPLALSDSDGPALALSSVVVSNQLQDPAAAGKGSARKSKDAGGSPLQLGNRSLLPSVTRVFRADQNLYVYLESYEGQAGSKGNAKGNGPDDAAQAVSSPEQGSTLPPSVALLFFRGGVKISEAGPFPGKRESAGKARSGKAAYFVQIPLQKFPPGRYSMQVNVLDPTSDRVAFTRVPIAIMRAQLKAMGTSSGG